MLEITLFGKKLKTPLILGSGTLGENKENLITALKYGAGAVVTRTLRIKKENRKIFNPAYFVEEKIYMLNSDNQNLTPWEYWIDKVEEIEKYGRLIVSLSARDPEGCKEIIATFEKNYPPSFYEINFSCPHSAKLYGEISYQTVEKTLEVSKKTNHTTFIFKIILTQY